MSVFDGREAVDSAVDSGPKKALKIKSDFVITKSRQVDYITTKLLRYSYILDNKEKVESIYGIGGNGVDSTTNAQKVPAILSTCLPEQMRGA